MLLKRKHLSGQPVKREKRTVSLSPRTWDYVRERGTEWELVHPNGEANRSWATERIIKEHARITKGGYDLACAIAPKSPEKDNKRKE